MSIFDERRKQREEEQNIFDQRRSESLKPAGEARYASLNERTWNPEADKMWELARQRSNERRIMAKQEEAYVSSLSDADREVYNRLKASDGKYTSPYMTRGRDGKSDLKYKNETWNALSKEEKEYYFDLAENNINNNKEDEEDLDYWEEMQRRNAESLFYEDNKWENKTADRKNDTDYAMTEYARKILSGDTSEYDYDAEAGYMWNSLPDEVKGYLTRGRLGHSRYSENNMTPKDVDAYLAENYSPEAAEFLRDYGSKLGNAQRMQEEWEDEERNLEDMGPAAAALYSTARRFIGEGAKVAAAPVSAYNAIRGVDDPYATGIQRYARMGDFIGADIAENAGSYELASIPTPFGKKTITAGDVYQQSYSIGQNVLRMGVAGLGGKALSSIPGLNIGAEAASKALNIALTSGGVFQDTYTQALEQGADTGTAILMAIGHAFTESLFEEISVDKLGYFSEAPVIANKKDLVKAFLKSMFVEGSEEFMTEFANQYLDRFIAYDYSDYKAFKDAYDAKMGVETTDREAWGAFMPTLALKAGEAFLGGALSGLVLGVGNMGGAYLRGQDLINASTTISDNEYKRFAPIVENYAGMFNRVRDEFSEATAAGEETRKGYVASILNAVNKDIRDNISYAANTHELHSVMESALLETNGAISEETFNAYNAKLVELGQKATAEYKTYVENLNKGKDTTFTDLVYGRGDNAISRNIVEASKSIAEAQTNADLTESEREKTITSLTQKVDENVKKAEELVARYAKMGKELDSPEIRQFENVLGLENMAQMVSAAKKANELEKNGTKQWEKQAGKIYQIDQNSDIAKRIFKDNVGHVQPIAYDDIKNTTEFALAKVLSGMSGVNVAFYTSDRKEIQNGAYDPVTNTILIDRKAGKTADLYAIGETMSHEFTHWLIKNNAAAFDTLKEFIRNELGEEEFNKQVTKHIENSKDESGKAHLDQAGAEEEIIAEACQRWLEHSEEFQKYAASDPEGAKTFIQRLIDFIRRLRDAFKGSLNNEVTGMVKDLDGLAKKLDALLTETLSKQTAEMSQEAAEGILENDPSVAEEIIGTKIVDEDSVKSSQRLNDELMDNGTKYLNSTDKETGKTIAQLRGISPMMWNRAVGQLKGIARRMLTDLAPYLPEDIPGKVEVGNASYGGKSMENTLVCIRSIINNDFTDMVSEELGRPLTVEEQLVASQILQIVNQRPECNYCYVATDRRAYRASFGTYFSQYKSVYDKVAANRAAFKNDLVGSEKRMEEVNVSAGEKNLGKGVIAKAYAEFLDGRKNTPDMRKRFSAWVKSAVNGNMPISQKDLTSARVRNKARQDGSKKWFIDDAEKYAQSATWAKKTSRTFKINGEKYVLDYVSYNGSILKWSQKVIDDLNSEFGLRMYSFSDYVPAFLLENMQMIMDASLRGLKVLAYTKDCGFAEAFADTGAGINISLFGTLDSRANNDAELTELRNKYKETNSDADRKAYLAALDKYVVRDGIGGKDGMMGANWDRASSLRNAYDNVGTVFVATNDDLVEWALANPDIDVVIPYHLVRTGEEVASFFNYKNYKAAQEDKKIKGEWATGNLKAVPPTVHRNNFDLYTKALKENNLTERFPEFIENPNYMKLVNETRMSYEDLQPVKPVFNQSIIDQELRRIKDEGQYGLMPGFKTKAEQDAFIENQNLVGQAVDAIGEWNETGKKPIEDVKYSFRGESSTMSKADQKNLAIAREMDEQNYDSEKIRLATGWFKGMDGKWRNELDDSSATLNFIPPSDLRYLPESYEILRDEARREANDLIKQMNELANKGVRSNDEQYKELNERYRKADDESNKYDKLYLKADRNALVLEDVLGHPKLFKAYPSLKSLPVSFTYQTNGVVGTNLGNGKGLTIAVDRSHPAEILNTLLHEVQHEIQRIEGFASGSNVEYWKANKILAREQNKEYKEAKAKVDELAQRLKKAKALVKAQKYADLVTSIKYATIDAMKKMYQYELDDIKKSLKAQGTLDLTKEYAEAWHELELAKIGADYLAKDAFDLYQRTAGEIESRDVSNRRQLSAKERKATRPDIDREDVVFANQNSGSGYSIVKTNGGTPVVIIDTDILAGVPQDKWVEAADNALKKFSPGIPIYGKFIRVNAKTRGEYTNSDNTKMYRANDGTIYEDKLRASGQVDEIVFATTKYVNEAPKHPRKDNITQFARGKVLIRSAANDYEADVVVGFTTGGNLLLYDVVGFNPTTKIKQAGLRPTNTTESSEIGGYNPATQNISQSETDVKYSSRDSEGRELSKGQQDYFKDSKIRDAEGNLKTMFHGTEADFNIFDFSQGGKNGTAEGFGIYLTDNEEVAKAYGGRIIKSYVNVTKPAMFNKKTITSAQLMKLIETTAKNQAQQMIDEEGYGTLEDAIKDTWISNYTYTYDKSLAASYREVANSIIRMSDNDRDIIQEVMSGMAIRDYDKAVEFYDVLQDVLGFDGFVTEWKNKNTGEKSEIVLAFNSNQVKNVDNENPTESDDIRYSERNAESESEVIVKFLQSSPNALEALGAKDSVVAYAKEYKELKAMEEEASTLNKRLKNKKSLTAEERQDIMKRLVKLDRAIVNKTTKLTDMRTSRVLRDVLKYESRERESEKRQARAEGKAIANERNEINHRKDSITRKAKALMKMITSPTEKKHIPSVMVKPIAEMLDSIDFWSVAEGKKPTKKSASLYETFSRFKQAYEDVANDVEKGAEDIRELFDPDFLEYVNELTKYVSDNSVESINDMSLEQIKNLDQLLTELNHVINIGNKMMTQSRFKTTDELRDATVQELNNWKGLKEDKSDAKGSFLRQVNAGMADAYAWGEYAGSGAKEIVRMLSKAYNRKTNLIRQATDFTMRVLDPVRKDINKWQKTEEEFKLASGQKVKMTIADMIDLYELSKREQALGHVLSGDGVGGIQVKNAKGKYTEIKRITSADLEKIFAYLRRVPHAIEVGDKLQNFLATTVADWGNKASNQMYGIMKFTDKNYWPIRSTSTGRKDEGASSDFSGNVDMNKIKNLGATKAVVKNANNAVYVENFLDVFSKHVDELSSYSELLPAITDAMRWWNSRTDSDGNRDDRVKDLLARKIGTAMAGNFKDIIVGLNGGVKAQDSLNRYISAIRGKVKAAAIALNPRVVVQQPFSYTRAAAVIEAKYLQHAMRMIPAVKEAQEHSAIAWLKHQGFHSSGIGPSMKKLVTGEGTLAEKITEKTMAPAGFADDVTWGTLWNAAKLKVEDKQKNLKKGSKEYWDAIEDIFDEIINRTQVVETPLTQSPWMKSNMGSIYMAFMNEPVKTYSMVMTAFDKLKRNPKNPEARRNFARAVTTFTISGFALALSQSLIDAARDDDKEKNYWEKYLEKYLGNSLENLNPMTYLPLVKDAWSTIQGLSSNDLTSQSVNNIINAVREAKLLARGESKYTLWGSGEIFAKALSYATGIPVSNAMRIFTSMGNLMGIDTFRRKNYTKSELGRNVILELRDGDHEAADKYWNQLVKEVGEDEIDKAYGYLSDYLSKHDDDVDAFAVEFLDDATKLERQATELIRKYDSEYITLDVATDSIRKAARDDQKEEAKAAGEKYKQTISSTSAGGTIYNSSDINRALEANDVKEAQILIDAINAGYAETDSNSTAKTLVTNYWKPKYLAAKGAERDRIAKMLYKLRNKGKQMFSAADLQKWVKDAQKKK